MGHSFNTYQKLLEVTSDMKLKLFLFFLSLSACVECGKIRLIGDGPVQRCDKKPAKDLIIDCGLEFLTEEDDALLNGNCTFNADVTNWLVSFWSEKKMGASWFRSPFQGSNIDVCKNLVDEKEFLHPALKGLPPCPFKKGVCLNFTPGDCCTTT